MSRYFTDAGRDVVKAAVRNARPFVATDTDALHAVLTAQRTIHAINERCGRTDELDDAALAAIEEWAALDRQARAPEWA